jgi:hypothetical protein
MKYYAKSRFSILRTNEFFTKFCLVFKELIGSNKMIKKVNIHQFQFCFSKINLFSLKNLYN